MRLITAIFLIIGLGCCSCKLLPDTKKCEVGLETESGTVCGRIRTAERKFKFASFRSVPYGKPPLAELRFQELQDVEPWQGLWDGRENSAACPQKGVLFGQLVQNFGENEDCIYLNLHVPYKTYKQASKSISSSSAGPRLPVIVMVHGGGFQVGSGATDLYGPEYFMTKDVIIVSCNYRLNVFGFLSLLTEKIPGNQALRDVIKCLKWVKRHATAFGGDVDNVTLMGHSSGASVAHLLTLSKAAEGLFHKVVLMSGTGIPNYFYPSQAFAKQIATIFLNTLGIQSTDPDTIHDQLIKTPLLDIMYANSLVQYDLGFTSFVPVVEKAFPNVTTVLDVDPIEALAQERGNQYPMMVGYVDQEMQFFKWVAKVWRIPERIQENINLIVPQRLLYNYPDRAATLVNKTVEKFFGGDFSMEKVLNCYGYTYFKHPAMKLAEIRSSAGAPTYLYRFSYKPERSLVSEGVWTSYDGAAHGEDLTMIYKVNAMLRNYVSFPPKNDDDKMKEWMVSFMSNFATCGNPTCSEDESNWPPVDADNLQYQDISRPMTYQMSELDTEEQDIKEFLDDIDYDLRKVVEAVSD